MSRPRKERKITRPKERRKLESFDIRSLDKMIEKKQQKAYSGEEKTLGNFKPLIGQKWPKEKKRQTQRHQLYCKQCGHKWTPRKTKPPFPCPQCGKIF